jgi:adenine-specific DNA-methyltransferase
MAVVNKPPSTVSRRDLGAYYTPELIARWLADQVVTATQAIGRPPTVVDPACGNGQLLDAVMARSPNAHVVGIDIDARAIAAARQRLGKDATLMHADALLTHRGDFAGRPADAIIANPPWGAALPLSAHSYGELGFGLARGQFDSYDLFTELALRWLPPGGVVGLVLPDSLLLPEHESTRRLLVRDSHILSLVRLGEGFFEGVFRGVMLLVARRGAPAPDAKVSCGRLQFAKRDLVLQGDLALEDALSLHEVPQSRFRDNAHSDFDLDVRSEETPFHVMKATSTFDWTGLVQWGRGIEIGKGGRIWRCSACGTSRPEPLSVTATCNNCGQEIDVRDREVIVRTAALLDLAPDWSPLIVGSDVTRYAAKASRQIRRGVSGIRYKEDLTERKLLVRKTGVGIQAAVDDSGTATTQSVFHCIAKAGSPGWMLDYLLGVLNSRPIQAFHLRQTGDHEWRSHPYVTPRTLRTLPIPSVMGSRSGMAIAREIARLAQLMSTSPTDQADYEIDRQVLSLYGIEETGGTWVHDVLASAQQLRPIARLVGSRPTLGAS